MIGNRGGDPPACAFVGHVEREARRYAADDTWARWTIEATLAEVAGRVEGRLVMHGPNGVGWDLATSGTFDRARCEVTATAGLDVPFDVTIRFGATITGMLRSSDDTLIIGPPFER